MEYYNTTPDELDVMLNRSVNPDANGARYNIKFGRAENQSLQQFLWYPYLPRKALVCLYGKQGAGKGFAEAAIGTHISNGTRPFESEKRTPETVFVISAEETSDEIELKFRYSGADMNRVARMGKMEILNEEKKPIFNIAERPHELAQAIRQCGAGLVMIDPIQDFIGVHSLNAAEEVGAALLKLMQIAEECDCTIMFLAHPSKKTVEYDLLDGVAGSAEFTRKPRTVLYLTYDETGTNKNRRVLVHVKHNGVAEGNALALEINTVDETEVEEQITDDSALPARASFIDQSMVNTDIVTAAITRKKRLDEYLAENPIELPNIIRTAADTLANLADKVNKNPLFVSRQGLQKHFPDCFSGVFTNIIERIKPIMYDRGYLCEYVPPMGRGRFDYYGIENQRALKLTKIKP